MYEEPDRLVLGVLRHSHHRRAKQAIFQLIATLQFVDDLMVWDVGALHHLDGLVYVRIEDLTFGRDRAHSQFCKCILQLLVDELNASAKIVSLAGRSLQGAFEAVEDGQESLDR